ncbi:hypothetical protein BDK51DRAFT_49723 [Blyttiomyces helicus]|uniref:Uncharacterized protein n=1 Tax=Blyttiomyces helicus TaxID=388810 RepID=A0A4P9WMV8_9FUNG|nr:hypothetical protein BDK51DRAFT_49723 [Blyttiomyces helicus]|eukprot:RKO94264.1 hypothetical protein BDK51DRAFT_49723 [Blyttiomyces helicus]
MEHPSLWRFLQEPSRDDPPPLGRPTHAQRAEFFLHKMEGLPTEKANSVRRSMISKLNPYMDKGVNDDDLTRHQALSVFFEISSMTEGILFYRSKQIHYRYQGQVWWCDPSDEPTLRSQAGCSDIFWYFDYPPLEYIRDYHRRRKISSRLRKERWVNAMMEHWISTINRPPLLYEELEPFEDANLSTEAELREKFRETPSGSVRAQTFQTTWDTPAPQTPTNSRPHSSNDFQEGLDLLDVRDVNFLDYQVPTLLKDGRSSHRPTMIKMFLEFGELNIGSDISSVDYGKYKEIYLTNVEEIRGPFVDTMVFFRLIPSSTITKGNFCTEVSKHREVLVTYLQDYCHDRDLETEWDLSIANTFDLSNDRAFSISTGFHAAGDDHGWVRTGIVPSILLRSPWMVSDYVLRRNNNEEPYGYISMKVQCSRMDEKDMPSDVRFSRMVQSVDDLAERQEHMVISIKALPRGPGNRRRYLLEIQGTIYVTNTCLEAAFEQMSPTKDISTVQEFIERGKSFYIYSTTKKRHVTKWNTLYLEFTCSPPIDLSSFKDTSGDVPDGRGSTVPFIMDPTVHIADLPRMTSIRFTDFQTASSLTAKGRTTHRNTLKSLCLQFGKLGIGSDIRDVDYGQYKQHYLDEVQELRGPYIDTAVLFKLIPSHTIQRPNVTENVDMYRSSLTDLIDIYCNSDKYAVTIARTCDISDDSRFTPTDDDSPVQRYYATKKDSIVTKILLQNPEFSSNYLRKHPRPITRPYGYISFKVHCSEMQEKDMLDFVFEEPGKTSLTNEFIHPAEFDFTMDLACSFSKPELSVALVSRLSLLFSVSTWVVLDCDKDVGRDCIILRYEDHSHNLKVKVYNKFAHMFQTKLVIDDMGFSLDTWINSPDELFRSSVKKSLDWGFTRVEITFYYMPEHTREYYLTVSEMVFDAVKQSGKLFKCPIESQWKSFCEELTSSVAIIDHSTKEYVVSLWHNSLTGRIAGTDHILTHRELAGVDWIEDWIAAHYSFKGHPMYVIQIMKDDHDSNIGHLNFRAFKKVGENPSTYIVGQGDRGIFYTIYISRSSSSSSSRNNKPEDMGIKPQPNIELDIMQIPVTFGTTKFLCNVEQIPFRTPAPSKDGYTFYSKEFAFRRKMIALDLKFTHKEKRGYQSLQTIEGDVRCSVVCWREARNDVAQDTFGCMMFEDGKVYAIGHTIATFIANNRDAFLLDEPTNIGYASQNFDPAFSFDIVHKDVSSSSRSIAIENLELCGDKLEEAGVELIPRIVSRNSICSVDILSEDKSHIVIALEIYKEKMKNSKIKTRFLLQIGDKVYRSNGWLEDMLNAQTSEDDDCTVAQTLLDENVPFRLLSKGKKTHKATRRTGLMFELDRYANQNFDPGFTFDIVHRAVSSSSRPVTIKNLEMCGDKLEQAGAELLLRVVSRNGIQSIDLLAEQKSYTLVALEVTVKLHVCPYQ